LRLGGDDTRPPDRNLVQFAIMGTGACRHRDLLKLFGTRHDQPCLIRPLFRQAGVEAVAPIEQGTHFVTPLM
jgi:hypothetical protein